MPRICICASLLRLIVFPSLFYQIASVVCCLAFERRLLAESTIFLLFDVAGKTAVITCDRKDGPEWIGGFVGRMCVRIRCLSPCCPHVYFVRQHCGTHRPSSLKVVQLSLMFTTPATDRSLAPTRAYSRISMWAHFERGDQEESGLFLCRLSACSAMRRREREAVNTSRCQPKGATLAINRSCGFESGLESRLIAFSCADCCACLLLINFTRKPTLSAHSCVPCRLSGIVISRPLIVAKVGRAGKQGMSRGCPGVRVSNRCKAISGRKADKNRTFPTRHGQSTHPLGT